MVRHRGADMPYGRPVSVRSIVVTGAGRGIGRAVAERFLAGGWRVAVLDVDEPAAAEVAADHPLAVAGHLDVRDSAQWQSALAEFCGGEPLDVLVNNAGVLTSGPVGSMDAAAHRRMVEVNLLGAINGCAAAHEHLRRSDHGTVINLCSAAALYGQATLATYSATKAGVKSLTEALDIEWAPDGIRVRSLLPMFVATEMVSRDQAGSAGVARYGVRLTPADVAEATWRLVHERDRRLRSPHRPVGPQARALSAVSAVSPGWAARLVARRLAR